MYSLSWEFVAIKTCSVENTGESSSGSSNTYRQNKKKLLNRKFLKKSGLMTVVRGERKPVIDQHKNQTWTKGGVNLFMQSCPTRTPGRKLFGCTCPGILPASFFHSKYTYLTNKHDLALTSICTSSNSSVQFPSNCPADAFRHCLVTLILVLPAAFVYTTIVTLFFDGSWTETC